MLSGQRIVLSEAEIEVHPYSTVWDCENFRWQSGHIEDWALVSKKLSRDTNTRPSTIRRLVLRMAVNRIGK